MKRQSTKSRLGLLSLLLAALPLVGATSSAWGSSHREAPLTAIDQKADITDWYAFVSYEDPSKVVMIMNVDPFLQPANGPTYFPFDSEILYEMKVDNTFDGDEDIVFQFRFKTEYRLPGVFNAYVGVGNGVNTPANSPPPVAANTPLIPRAVTALDGAGSEGLNLRQTYTVTRVRKVGGVVVETTDLSAGRRLFVVPSNSGPRTMPNYQALAQQGIYNLGAGVRVFAGTVDDPFYIDLGAAFDTLNFRVDAAGTGVPAVLSNDQDADDTRNFAADSVSGFNVNSIVIEVPTTMLTSDGALHSAGDARAVIGTYATTSRPRIKTQPSTPGGKPALSTNFVQIQRMGNSLINELLIGIGDKDKWSMSEPKNDSQFATQLLDPLLPRVLNALYGGAVPIPTPPRLDLAPLVFYAAPICPGCTAAQAGPLADLLRLNTGIPATPRVSRKRLGVLAGDLGGYPNGRRISDDVVDISTRVAVGVLAGPPFSGFPNNRLGDGVNANDRPYQEVFPYVAFANSGRDSRHVDPTEPGCADVVVPFLPKNCPIN